MCWKLFAATSTFKSKQSTCLDPPINDIWKAKIKHPSRKPKPTSFNRKIHRTFRFSEKCRMPQLTNSKDVSLLTSVSSKAVSGSAEKRRNVSIRLSSHSSVFCGSWSTRKSAKSCYTLKKKRSKSTVKFHAQDFWPVMVQVASLRPMSRWVDWKPTRSRYTWFAWWETHLSLSVDLSLNTSIPKEQPPFFWILLWGYVKSMSLS